MSLNEGLKDLSLHHGADYFGVADLTQAYKAILEQGGATIAQYPRAISVGILCHIRSSINSLLAQNVL